MQRLCPTSSDLVVKIISGLLAGTTSSAICNPTDVLKTRMQSSSVRGLSLTQSFIQIIREEGLASLWLTGLIPNVLRAAVLTAAELATYDVCRPLVAEYTQSEILKPILSAMVASVVSAFTSCPFDTVKSRMMNQSQGIKDKTPKYRSTIDCFQKSVSSEGLLVLWSGLVAYFMRLLPNTILTFFFLEKIRLFLSIIFDIRQK